MDCRCKRIALIIVAILGVVTSAPTVARAAEPAGAQASRENTPTDGTVEMTTTAPAGKADYHVLQDRPDRLIVELPNHMVVIAQEFKAAPVVSAQVWVKTGSIYEQEHTGAGLSHFLEHLLSGGTTSTRTEEESKQLLGQIGARSNASTSLDNVRYYIDTTRAHTDTAIELLSDWMQNALITETEYKRERDVIQREFDMGQGDPGRIFWKVTQSVRYSEHPARHPTIGYLNEFLSVSRQEIYDFYRRMYVPNNMVFVVAGDIDRHAVVSKIASEWKDAKAKELPSVSLPIEPAREDGPRVGMGSADIKRPRLRLAWPGTRVGGEGDYALDLLAVLLGQGESSRLVRNVRDKGQKVSTINAYNLSFPWGEGFFAIDAEVVIPPVPQGKTLEGVTVEATNEAKQAILAEVARLSSQGVTAEELARAKRKTLAAVVFDGQEANEIAARLAGDTIGMGDPDYRLRYVAAIESLTPDDVAVAASRFLDNRRLMELTLNPLGKDEKPEVMQRPTEVPVAKPAPRETITLDNVTIVTRLMSLRSDGANATPLVIEPIQRFEMPNGLRLLVQRSTIAPAVSIQMYRLGGLLADEPGREGVTGAMSAMLLKGTVRHSATEISDMFDNLGVQVGSECGNNTSFIRAMCLREDWKTVLDLIADVTVHPTFPDDEWDKMRPRLLAAIAREQDAWSGELRARFREAYYGSNPLSQSPLGRAAVIDSLTTRQLRDFHTLRLSASQTVLAVFGDVNVEEVKAAVAKAFEDMPREALSPVQIVTPETSSSRVVEAQTKKPLAAVMIAFGPGVARASADYAPLQVLTRVLSSFPSGWLEEELRGRGPGLVYAVGAYQTTGLVPGYFAVSFNAQPGTASEAIARSMRVVDRARTELMDATTLARAKAGVLTDAFSSRQADADRAADAALNEMYGLGLDEPTQFLAAVEQVTPETLKAVAELYLRNPLVVVLSHQALDAEALKKAVEWKALGETPAESK